MDEIVVGSRDSKLAVAQTEWVIEELKKANTSLKVEHRLIKTSGDKDQTTQLDKFAHFGVFVKELQIALIEKEIDLAVHSLKDVPEDQPEDLALVSFPEREDPRDVLISKGKSFLEIKNKGKIGTGSPRRILQLKKVRGDLSYLPIRGNLDTRINKVTEGELDGIVLAAAGLNRLNWKEHISHTFSFDHLVPSIGQGCLALECRVADLKNIEIARSINDDLTEASVLMEREFMSQVGGGCKVPMACHVYPSGEGFRMIAVMGDLKSGEFVRCERSGDFDSLQEIVMDVTDQILFECKENGIPIPKDLPKHHLLNDDK